MARRSKTKIGGGSQEQSRTMMQAAESGHDRQAQAHRDLMAQRESGKRYTTQLSQQAGASITESQRYNEQQEFKEKATTGEHAFAQQRLDLQAEQQGKQRSADAPTSPLLDDRQKRLQSEMQQGGGAQGGSPATSAGQAAQMQAGQEPNPGAMPQEQQQNLAAQVSKPASLPGGRSFVDTPQGAAAGRQQAAVKAAQTTTQLQNAEANLLNAKANYSRATGQGGEEGIKRREAADKVMMKSMQTTRDIITQVQTGKVDPLTIAQAHMDNPNMKELAEGGGGPESRTRAVQFLRGQLGMQGIGYASTTGRMPPGMEPDNPIVQRFNNRFGEVATAFQTMQQSSQMQMQSQAPAFQQAAQEQPMAALAQAWQGISSYEDRNEFLTKVTARTMIDAEQIRRAQKMAPAASGSRQRIQSLQQQNMQLQQQNQALMTAWGGASDEQRSGAAAGAVQQARGAGGTPEQSLRAGQAIDPTGAEDPEHPLQKFIPQIPGS